ncbi:uncharacterized protein AMSG_03800 [Thecamonas trahens ATCC 50062]|uniref:Uncharacterized protein n=1 Tax=Thecamonas trahens ATCC 50062 TaxID=461836 RepID=A0A0L0D5J8_THETB|nr:hypothetical protein AMSG_03800 [Thecamonas trahens ATCC 50062]KNC47366.1 hypothetical protein AMSG_03800 [Thecamonas trahens ATCC 50062]|eukprot:XP_013759704.1 hypothetical protein AMSG_03800 [Thecamonas trahens ATCC 50062]
MGFFVCLDALLYHLTFLPVRIAVALTTLPGAVCGLGAPLSSQQACDLLRGLIFAACFALLSLVDASYVYHMVRGQSSIKLYVIFNCCEIFDKLCCALGLDILDTLFGLLRASVTRVTGGRRGLSGPHEVIMAFGTLPILGSALAAVVYVAIHAAVLFTLSVSINVAINSYNNALVTLLVSNQIIELKKSVFKRCVKENLFQLACADIVERAQLFIFLAVVCLQNLVQDAQASWAEFLGRTGRSVLIFWASEIVVDSVKHSFICKFNKLDAGLYSKFSSILYSDIINGRLPASQPSAKPHHAVSHRIGFVPIPLACLFLHTISRVLPLAHLPRWSPYWLAVVVTCYLNLVALKILVSICLLGRAAVRHAKSLDAQTAALASMRSKATPYATPPASTLCSLPTRPQLAAATAAAAAAPSSAATFTAPTDAESAAASSSTNSHPPLPDRVLSASSEDLTDIQRYTLFGRRLV